MRPTRRAAKRSYNPVESSDDDEQPLKKKSPQQLPQQLNLSDDSSSDSDIETYLKPPSKLDLDSSFFNPQKTNDDQSMETSEERKEVSFDSSDSDSNENIVEDIPMMDFEHINNYNKKLEEARQFIEVYKAKKAEEGKPDEVSDILKLGEGINVDEEFFNSLGSEDFETMSDSDKEDWEVVEGKEDKVEEKRGVEITISGPMNVKKKKGVDLMAMVKRKINRVKKETQVFVHKVHLLTWVAHGLSVNNVLNDQYLLGLGLSLLPSQHCLPKSRLDITYLETIVNWYRKLIVNKELPGNPKKKLVKNLEEQILKKEAHNHKYFVYIFLIILRSLGFSCRLVLSLQVQPLRPPPNELLSVSSKKEPPENKIVQKTPKPITVPSSKLNSSKILDKSISSTKKLKDKLNLSKSGLMGLVSTSKEQTPKESKSGVNKSKSAKDGKFKNKSKEDKEEIKVKELKSVISSKKGNKTSRKDVKNKEENTVQKFEEKEEYTSNKETNKKQLNIDSKKRTNTRKETKKDEDTNSVEKNDATGSKRNRRTSRRIDKHKKEEVKKLSNENPKEDDDETVEKQQKKTTKDLEKVDDLTDLSKVTNNQNKKGSKASSKGEHSTKKEAVETSSFNNSEENTKLKEEEILKTEEILDKTDGREKKKTSKGVKKPGSSTDMTKKTKNQNKKGFKDSNNAGNSRGKEAIEISTSKNLEENTKLKEEEMLKNEDLDKTDRSEKKKTSKGVEKPGGSKDLTKKTKNQKKGFKDSNNAENSRDKEAIEISTSKNLEENTKLKEEEILKNEEDLDKTDGSEKKKTSKGVEKPGGSKDLTKKTKNQNNKGFKDLNNSKSSTDKEPVETSTFKNPEENTELKEEEMLKNEETPDRTDRRKQKTTTEGGGLTDMNKVTKNQNKKKVSNNPEETAKLPKKFKVKLPIKKKSDQNKDEHFSTSESEEEMQRNFQVLKPKQLIIPKMEVATPKQPTSSSGDEFLGFDESIPQFDGANDTDSSSSSKNRKSKPNLSKLKSPAKCETRNCEKRQKQNPNYMETDSDEDFTPKTWLPKRNSKPSTSTNSSSDSDRSRFFAASKKLDVRNDIMSLVQQSIAEEKLDKRRKLIKRKSNSGDDGDYLPQEMKKVKVDDFKEKAVTKVKRRIPTRKELLELEEKKKIEREEKRRGKGVNVWIEVFAEAEEKWISVDIDKGQVHCVKEIFTRATHPVSYILAFDNTNHIKDITKRYCSTIWNTTTRKLRVDDKWWESTLKPYQGPKTPQDKEEDEDLAKIQLEQPLPTTISEYKNHPLYVLRRHLLKFEAIYPPDSLTLGFVRNEPVYSRDCVYTLHSRDIWLKHAKVVKAGETPYKIVKARPKYDKLSNTVITDQPLEVFGEWQIEDYVPPTAENGIVPRNAYGNVELFKACMLPKGTVHMQLPGLNKVAKKLNIDCAPAVVGFDFHSGWSHPTFDGFVVCEEFAETLTAAWFEDQVEAEKRAEEKIEKRVYGNWRRLIRGLLIRERLKIKYDFGLPSTSSQPEKSYKKSMKK